MPLVAPIPHSEQRLMQKIIHKLTIIITPICLSYDDVATQGMCQGCCQNTLLRPFFGHMLD